MEVKAPSGRRKGKDVWSKGISGACGDRSKRDCDPQTGGVAPYKQTNI